MNNKPAFSQDLFILDLANNHFGDVEHALRVVDEVSEVVHEFGVRAALKLQLRNLDSFIHPSMRESDHRYVRRFLDTSLSFEDFARISDRVHDAGLKLMATPFDEDSIELLSQLGVSIAKVASASASDLPLLDALARTKFPIVASTGGLTQLQIDMLHQRLLISGNEFALMHCVSVYPSAPETHQLRQITNFRTRYPGIPVGWSTHEKPSHLEAITIAKSLGASLFERHVGLDSSIYPLNDYSSSPQQLANWFRRYFEVSAELGSQVRLPSSEEELQTLGSLRRGYFFSTRGKAGDLVASIAVAAFPVVAESQVTTGDSLSGLKLARDVEAGEPVLHEDCEETEPLKSSVARHMFEVAAKLAEAQVRLNDDAEVELSHHYGIDRFREYGATLITVLNREYAKKIVVLLPRQKHPSHRHTKKEETFQLLWGDLEIAVNGAKLDMRPGQVVTVHRGDWHSFNSTHGAIVEEISSHAFDADSEYEDSVINTNLNRKTVVPDWSNYMSPTTF